MALAEYVWLDGTDPVQELRSKARFLPIESAPAGLADFPQWSFDGSSTGQAERFDSDCGLVPACFVRDPFRGPADFIVLCEVTNGDGSDHASNARASLRNVLDSGADEHDPWIGFEQEYTLFEAGRPLGFPIDGPAGPQGPYYCSIGGDRAFGRVIAEEHAKLCQQAGLLYCGLNAEAMPGQWEFQIGYRGVAGEDPGLLNACDHLWLARYILHRVAERHGVTASLANKPVPGDWNGAGMHANFSCAGTRGPGGLDVLYRAIKRLARTHRADIASYGEGLTGRLTGEHATCPIGEFRAGGADRGASIRIPLGVEQKGCGYFEDRRPGANADPYRVAARLAATVFAIEHPVQIEAAA